MAHVVWFLTMVNGKETTSEYRSRLQRPVSSLEGEEQEMRVVITSITDVIASATDSDWHERGIERGFLPRH